MRVLPTAYLGTIESVRCAPTSWAEVVYHSCLAYPFIARDGKRRYLKYRLLLDGLEQESGLIDSSMQIQPWVQRRPAKDSHPVSYLVDEYRDRVVKAPIVYRLEIQWHDWHAKETPEFFNSAHYWDEKQFPWVRLATVEITEALADP